MKIDQILKETNEAFRQIQKETKSKPNDKEFTRQFLLKLNELQLSPEEMKIGLVGALDKKKNIELDCQWQALAEEVYVEYMLEIGTEEKPYIQPAFGCWLDIYNHTISTKRQVDLFTGKDFCVWLNDYRVIDENIDWKQIAEGGEM